MPIHSASLSTGRRFPNWARTVITQTQNLQSRLLPQSTGRRCSELDWANGKLLSGDIGSQAASFQRYGRGSEEALQSQSGFIENGIS
jgi:hypothetical protein